MAGALLHTDGLHRCPWPGKDDAFYVAYHDKEWGVLRTDDAYLFEMLLLESFQAGLSWECILNKRENFRKAFDDFQAEKIAAYTAEKCSALAADKGIVRNRRKIHASVRNAAIFLAISAEFGSFYNYLCQFTQGRIFYETGKATSPLSDAISADLQKRGMKFVGSTIIYAYLQAVGILYSHDAGCDLYRHS